MVYLVLGSRRTRLLQLSADRSFGVSKTDLETPKNMASDRRVRFTGRTLLWPAILVGVVSTGCFGVKGPDKPDFDPAASAASAFEAYDANTDGFIDDKEVEESPGMLAAFERIDKDGDKKVTPEELSERIRYYKNAGVTVISGAVRVSYKGKPLPDAEITFEPEPFLGDAFQACSATTDYDGLASVSGTDAQFPGLYLGFYRVTISKEVNGREKIPKKYNEESTIGYEACDDDIEQFADVISFKLK